MRCITPVYVSFRAHVGVNSNGQITGIGPTYMCLLGLYVFCRTGIVNCVRPFNRVVLSVTFLIFSVGYDKVEFYHLAVHG